MMGQIIILSVAATIMILQMLSSWLRSVTWNQSVTWNESVTWNN